MPKQTPKSVPVQSLHVVFSGGVERSLVVKTALGEVLANEGGEKYHGLVLTDVLTVHGQDGVQLTGFVQAPYTLVEVADFLVAAVTKLCGFQRAVIALSDPNNTYDLVVVEAGE